MKKNIFISVSCKKEIEKFGSLDGWVIIAPTETKQCLDDLGVDSVSLSSFTGYPGILDGNLEIFHPKIFGSIVASESNLTHLEDLRLQLIEKIDVFVLSVPTFNINKRKEVFNSGSLSLIVSLLGSINNITCVVDREDYDAVIKELKSNGVVSVQTREMLLAKALERVSNYLSSFHSHVVYEHNEKKTVFV